MKIRSLVTAAAASIVLGAAGWVLPHLSAQTIWDTVKVNLPYTVTLGDKTLSPGDYTIKQLDNPGGDSPVLLIYNHDGMKFQTSAMTIKALDPNTPQDTSVTLHHIGDNYYFDKVWIQGKNYGYEIPLPKSVREREAEATAAVSVPAQIDSTSTTTSSATDSTTTTTAENATPPPPPPPPAEEPAAVTPPPPPPPAPEPQATTDTTPTPQPAPTSSSDDNSANREAHPDNTPEMPSTSAGWLAILLSGGTLSSAGMMLRRRKQ